MSTQFTRDAVKQQSGANLPSAKQLNFIRSLLPQCYEGEQLDRAEARFEALVANDLMTKQIASETITALIQRRDERKEQRRQQQSIPTQQEASPLVKGLRALRGGHYAAQDTDRIRFFKIDVVREGKWGGWVFIKEQASDDLFPVGKVTPADTHYKGRYTDLLNAVVSDEMASQQLYGQELGHCGVCGRTLTDELSRELGIGPVCREKVGL